MLHSRTFFFSQRLLSAAALLLAAAVAYGQTSVVQVGTTIEGLSFADQEDSITFPLFRLDGSFARRSALDSGGFLLLSGGVGLDYAGSPLSDYRDREFINLETELPLTENRLALEAGIESSLYRFGGGPRLEPEWAARYRFTGPRRQPEPWFGYLGSAVYDTDTDDSRTEHGATIGVSHRPSLRLGYEVAAEAVGGWWYDWPVYLEDGSTGSSHRRDLLLRTVVNADGLIGYFADWEALLAGGYRFSTANRYLETENRLQNDSEERIEIESSLAFGYSPSRSVEWRLGLGGEAALYPRRSVLETDASASTDTVRWYDINGEFSVDLTPDDAFYLTFAVTGSSRLSSDPELRARSAGASFSVTRVIR